MCIHVLHSQLDRQRFPSDGKQMLALIFEFLLCPDMLRRKLHNWCGNVQLLNLSSCFWGSQPFLCYSSVFTLSSFSLILLNYYQSAVSPCRYWPWISIPLLLLGYVSIFNLKMSALLNRGSSVASVAMAALWASQSIQAVLEIFGVQWREMFPFCVEVEAEIECLCPQFLKLSYCLATYTWFCLGKLFFSSPLSSWK